MGRHAREKNGKFVGKRLVEFAFKMAGQCSPLLVLLFILEIHACNNPSPVFKICILSAVASTSSQGVCEVRQRGGGGGGGGYQNVSWGRLFKDRLALTQC